MGFIFKLVHMAFADTLVNPFDSVINALSSLHTNFYKLFELSWPIFIAIVYLFVLSSILYGIYYLLFVPINRIKTLGSIGYINHHGDQYSKKDIANLIRHRRKIGDDLPPVFPNGWFRLLDSWELNKGKVKEVSCLGQHFAVYRGENGKVNVLDAYCPHMGGNLAQGGRVLGNCLQCPFHGWTFSGDGKCTDVPYSNKVPNFSSTKSWPCNEINGAIFVWYHCDRVEPEWEIPEIEEIRSGKFSYRGRVEHHANTHIQDVPENGSDIAHLRHLHLPNIISGNDLSVQFDKWFNFIEHLFTAECIGPDKEQPHISRMRLLHQFDIFRKWKCYNLHLDVYQIGPGIVHLHFTHLFGRGVLVQTLVPLEPLYQVLSHSLYTDWYFPMCAGRLFLMAEAIQVDRDVMIWNNKTFSSKPRLLKEDVQIAKYRRWFSQFYSENSPRLEMKAEDNLSW